MANEEFAVGFVRGSFGTAGGCKIESASGEYAHIAALKEVALCKDGKRKVYAIESAEMKGSFLCMKFKGIDSPEQVKEISGASLVVPRQYAKPLEKGEWYVEDLLQCKLVYDAGEKSESVGTIKAVVEGGGGNLLEVDLDENCPVLAQEIKYTADGKVRTVYVPFRNEYVGEVDVVQKTVQLLNLWILE